MFHDSITDEIRAIRHSLAEKLDNDLVRIVADLQRQQQESGRQYLSLPKRTPRSGEHGEPSVEDGAAMAENVSVKKASEPAT
jgi:hypothetical protein